MKTLFNFLSKQTKVEWKPCMKYFPLYLLMTGATPHTYFHFGRIKQEHDSNYTYGVPCRKYAHHACTQKPRQCCARSHPCPSCEIATDLILVRHFLTFLKAFLYTCNIVQSVVTQSVTRTKPYITLQTSGLLQRDLHQ